MLFTFAHRSQQRMKHTDDQLITHTPSDSAHTAHTLHTHCTHIAHSDHCSDNTPHCNQFSKSSLMSMMCAILETSPNNYLVIELITIKYGCSSQCARTEISEKNKPYNVLQCTVMYNNVMYNNVLSCTVMYNNVLSCTVMYYNVLSCTVMYNNVQ